MLLTIERAQGMEAQREQTVNMVTDRMKLSESDSLGNRLKWPRLYDLWRGSWTGRYHPHKNNVHIPLIFSAIWADAARKAATSLNMWPIVTFLGYGPDDSGCARKREALCSAQFKDDDAFQKQVDMIVQADLYGKAVMQVGWKRTEEERILEYVDRLPMSGEIVKSIKKGKIVSFDGPESIPVDLLDFFPQPGMKRIKDMRWCIRRYFLDLDEVRYLVSEDIFDKPEFHRMVREGGVGGDEAMSAAMVSRFAIRNGMDEATTRFMDKYSRPIEILEYWGFVPSELSPDGVLKRVITVANRRYLFRNRPLPFWHNALPFLEYSPTPDPHYFYAPGKAEIVEKLQITGNRYLNQTLDAADLVIDPMWFYDRGAGLNTKNLYAKPGRFIPVDGNPSEVVSPLVANLQSLLLGDKKIDQMREYANMGTGIVDDAVAGLQGSDRQTAREFIGRREAAGTRLLLESRLYEETFLERLANMFIALDKQFLEPPVEVLILADGAQFDSVTGDPIAASRETLSHFDLVPNYAARAVGATSALSKGMRQQNMIQLLTVMGSPLGQMVMGQINALNFWRAIFREFEVPNINEIFKPGAAGGAGTNLNQLIQNATGGQGGNINQIPTSGQVVTGVPIPGNPGIPQGNETAAPIQAMQAA
jgi:hypothetical protein